MVCREKYYLGVPPFMEPSILHELYQSFTKHDWATERSYAGWSCPALGAGRRVYRISSRGTQTCGSRHGPCDFEACTRDFTCDLTQIWPRQKWIYIYIYSVFEWGFNHCSIIVNSLGLRNKWEEIMVVTQKYPRWSLQPLFLEKHPR